MPTHLLQDDVDVAGDELSDLLALGGLDRVVPVLVVPEVLQAEPGGEVTSCGKTLLIGPQRAGSISVCSGDGSETLASFRLLYSLIV